MGSLYKLVSLENETEAARQCINDKIDGLIDKITIAGDDEISVRYLRQVRQVVNQQFDLLDNHFE